MSSVQTSQRDHHHPSSARSRIRPRRQSRRPLRSCRYALRPIQMERMLRRHFSVRLSFLVPPPSCMFFSHAAQALILPHFHDHLQRMQHPDDLTLPPTNTTSSPCLYASSPSSPLSTLPPFPPTRRWESRRRHQLVCRRALVLHGREVGRCEEVLWVSLVPFS
jgi:hypothetical protein